MAGRRVNNGATLGFEETLWQAGDKMSRNLKGLGSMSEREKWKPETAGEKGYRPIVQQPLAQIVRQEAARSLCEIRRPPFCRRLRQEL